jgi:NitT/TauT family transport system permease protein
MLSNSEQPISEAAYQRRRRKRYRTVLENLAPFVITALILLAWQVLVPWARISRLILPTPTEILSTMYLKRALLLHDTGVTMLEVFYGFVSAAVVGIPLALGIFYSPMFGKSIYPILVALQTVPKVALAPILVMWFGFGILPKIAVSFLISVFPIVIATVVGLTTLERDMIHLVRSMGANEFQTFIKIRLPSALPSIFGGLKVAIGLSIVGAVIGEYIAAEGGLGYRQLTANLQFDSALNFAALMVIAGCGMITFATVETIERLLIRRR